MTKLGACCVWGCCDEAVEVAAPNVHYCRAHAASNRAATRQMQAQQTHAAIDGAIQAAADRNLLARCVIDGHEAVDPDTGQRRLIQRHWRRLIAVCEPRYKDTSYGEVAFVDPGDPRYAEYAAAAMGDWPD